MLLVKWGKHHLMHLARQWRWSLRKLWCLSWLMLTASRWLRYADCHRSSLPCWPNIWKFWKRFRKIISPILIYSVVCLKLAAKCGLILTNLHQLQQVFHCRLLCVSNITNMGLLTLPLILLLSKWTRVKCHSSLMEFSASKILRLVTKGMFLIFLFHCNVYKVQDLKLL